MSRFIPVETLKALFAYCHLTGKVTHLLSRGKAKAGEEAGSIRKDGYRVIKVSHQGRRVQIMAHIIGWAIHHGHYPEIELDHRDTIRTHNHIENLRPATRSQQILNQRKRKGKWPKWVLWIERQQRFVARINNEQGKRVQIGTFLTAEDAHAVARAEMIRIHGDFARPE